MCRQRESLQLKLTPFMCAAQRGTPAANGGVHSKRLHIIIPSGKNLITLVFVVFVLKCELHCFYFKCDLK